MQDAFQMHSPDTARQWLFSLEALAATPGVLSGGSGGSEAASRLSTNSFIEKVASKLRGLPTETVAVAKVFHLRFSMRIAVGKENTAIHPYVVGATALFLACKATDHYKKLSTVIYYCRHAAFKGPPGVDPEFVQMPEFKENDREYEKWYDNIITTEEQMTSALCFDFVVQLPHELIPTLLELCFDGSRLESNDEEIQTCTKIYQKLRHHAYYYANECMSTTLPLRYNRNLLALIILRLAVEATKKSFSRTNQPQRVTEFLQSLLLAPTTDHNIPRTNLFFAHDLFETIAKYRGANAYNSILYGAGTLFGTLDSGASPKPLTGPALSEYLLEAGKEIVLVSNRPKYEKYMNDLLAPLISRMHMLRKQHAAAKASSGMSPALIGRPNMSKSGSSFPSLSGPPSQPGVQNSSATARSAAPAIKNLSSERPPARQPQPLPPKPSPIVSNMTQHHSDPRYHPYKQQPSGSGGAYYSHSNGNSNRGPPPPRPHQPPPPHFHASANQSPVVPMPPHYLQPVIGSGHVSRPPHFPSAAHSRPPPLPLPSGAPPLPPPPPPPPIL
ncbi:hypothetical protein BDR26DRAFT_850619 [Obelidium mucronatum]|nr:hypothetical protein BDR26DRAFT_850619 [Obelidium mucronatum]